MSLQLAILRFKTNLVTDLPGPDELLCQELWPQSQTNMPDIDTKHTIKAADYICMDTPITYNDRIPTHGPYGPVEAESGEYLYCPPQRWLQNLKNGALVFLYHPCIYPKEVERLKSLKNCCMETLSLIEVQRTGGRTRKSRMVIKQSLEEVELKDDVKPDEFNTKSAKLNHTDTLPQNNTKEMASFSMLTVTQSLSSAKDSKEPGDSAKDKTKTIEKQFLQHNVTERLKYHIDKKTHKKTIKEGKSHHIKTDTKEQMSGSECVELGQCGVPDSKSPHIRGPLRGERIPIPHTDEAVWAAGALGFLLVLPTLSVLHTRLYRHCRSSASLYWHDNQQDYENVGDIIRRRLRMVGRRKRRSSQSRRQISALLSNSSNGEISD
ncbi:uncharacterized protein LOC107744806 [Sinocyclocheilus rhinocerous]|uniref:uncharacterized protein LOC107744806 n=1 Tax=Sinocyclocheilus rhinocerous TaxID=307959 RepID=UPI0007B9F0B3|nr:PREDICTED: uncharacterized protein LOC107744806 [Sinocyclocheilus rhinocerous]